VKSRQRRSDEQGTQKGRSPNSCIRGKSTVLCLYDQHAKVQTEKAHTNNLAMLNSMPPGQLHKHTDQLSRGTLEVLLDEKPGSNDQHVTLNLRGRLSCKFPI